MEKEYVEFAVYMKWFDSIESNMRYKKTKIFIRPNAPLWRNDLVLKQVQIEDLKENSTVTPYKPIPFTPEKTLERSVGLENIYKNIIKFTLEFRP